MANKLTAPRMGEGIEELNVIKWLKQEGDQVKELEPLVEVETDKVVTEIPSPVAGVLLRIMVAEGQAVGVGEILAWIGKPGEEIIESKETVTSLTNSKTTNEKIDDIKTEPRQTKDTFISPLVRKIARENQIDLKQVSGSGKDGRITKKDVMAYLETRTTPHKGMPAIDEIPPLPTRPLPPTGVQPISHIRRRIAEHMRTSLQTSPHVLTVMEADLSRVQDHRTANKSIYAQDGIHLTLTAYFVAAIVEALKTNPLANSSWSEEGIIMHADINIGIAVSLGAEGLIVPVIKQAETLSLLGIAGQVNDLATRARAGKLLPQEVKGGTFSLTNHGLGGSLFAFPIINQPQVGILGTGIMQKRTVVLTDEQGNDSIAIRPMIYLSFVFDHRVLDGESADQFLGVVKTKLENWD